LEELLPKDKENIRLPLLGPVEPSEPLGFTPDQMIRCEECLRANPPTRINCLYCNVQLPVTESSARLRKPILRRPEKHQLGYNTIVLPGSETLTPAAIAAAAPLLKLKEPELERILAERLPLPLARTASREESELIFDRLQELGLRVVTLVDEGTVRRVKSLAFAEAQLVLNSGHPQDELAVQWSNILLYVTARLIEKRVEVNEVKSRRAENEITDASEFFNDEPVIDIYCSTHSETWRVGASGFDFSCLGTEKALVSNENIVRLQRRLLAHTPGAQFDDSYNRLRPVLDLVWGPEQETKSRGWRRERPGKLSLGMATINSNEPQFTRYSRLRYHVVSKQIG
jgi:hypothetical protein